MIDTVNCIYVKQIRLEYNGQTDGGQLWGLEIEIDVENILGN
jgi:hypothetical protein